MMKSDQTIRLRSLRAARVATLGLVVTAPGCYAAHEGASSADDGIGVGGPDVVVMPLPDAGYDAGRDAGVVDGVICDLNWDWEDYQQCCDDNGWDWERGCAAWGPFVPPGDGVVA